MGEHKRQKFTQLSIIDAAVYSSCYTFMFHHYRYTNNYNVRNSEGNLYYYCKRKSCKGRSVQVPSCYTFYPVIFINNLI